MATVTTLSQGDISTATIALSASSIDTVTFGDDCDMVEVLNIDGVSPIVFTVNGVDPSLSLKNQYFVPASAGASLEVTVPTGGNTTVKLLSAGTAQYRVTRTA